MNTVMNEYSCSEYRYNFLVIIAFTIECFFHIMLYVPIYYACYFLNKGCRL